MRNVAGLLNRLEARAVGPYAVCAFYREEMPQAKGEEEQTTQR